MDERDLVVWGALSISVLLVAWAGELWIDLIAFGRDWYSRRQLPTLTVLAAMSLLLAPLLTMRVGGARLGSAVARGLAVSCVLLGLVAAIVLPRSAYWWANWAIVGAACGGAMGLSWAMVLPQQRLRWFAALTLWGVGAGWLSTVVRGIPLFSGWAFGLAWALAALPLAWALRAHYAPEFTTPSTAPSHYWRAALVSSGAIGALALLISSGWAIQPCGPVARSLNRAVCVSELDRGELYNIFSIAFAANGQTLWLGGGRLQSWGAVQQHRLSDGAVLQHFPTDTAVQEMAISPSGKLLVALDWSDMVYVWETATGREQHRFRTEGYESFRLIRISPDDRYAAFASNIYDLHTGQPVGTAYDPAMLQKYNIERPNQGLRYAWSDNGRVRSELEPWDTERLTAAGYAYARDLVLVPGDLPPMMSATITPTAVLERFPGPLDEFPYISFSPDGRFILAAYNDHYIAYGYPRVIEYLRIWRRDTGAIILDERQPSSQARDLFAWTADGELLAMTDMFGPVRLIRVAELDP